MWRKRCMKNNNGLLTPAQIMTYIADGIKSGAIRSNGILRRP